MAAGDIVKIGGRRYISRGTTGKESISKNEAKKRLKSSKSKSRITKSIFSKVPDSVLEGANVTKGNGKSIRASGGGNITTTMKNTKTGTTTKTITSDTGALKEKIVRDSRGKIIQSYKGNTKLQQQFSNVGLGFLANTYNEDQLKRIYRRLTTTQDRTIPDKLEKIDKSNLSPIRKEIEKRKLLGIKSGNIGFGETLALRKKQKTKQLAALIKISPSEKLAKKIINGESLTPTQQKRFIDYNKARAGDLTKQQLNILKNLPKDVGLGLWEVGKETVIFSYDVLKGSYKTGEKLGDALGDAVLGDTTKLKRIGSKAYKTFEKGTYSLAKVSAFVQTNPKQSAAIVGTAVSAGLAMSLNSFAKNPVKSLTKAVAYLYGGKILSKAPGVKQLSNFLRTEKFSKNIYRVKSSLTTGVIDIEGVSRGKLRNGKSFTSDYTLKYNPKSKTINGKIKTKVGKKEFIQKISLKDEGTYYLDKKTKQRISKVKAPISNRNIKITEQKIIPRDSSLVLIGDITAFKGEADIFTTISKITNKLNTKTQKVSKGLKIVDAKTKKTIKNIVKDISVETKTKRAKLPKQLSKSQISQLEKFLKSINYDKVLLEGLDKRQRLAIALGLRKDAKLLKKIEALVDSKGNVYGYIKRKGTFKAIGTIERGKIPNVRVKKKGVQLKKNKKGTVSIFKDNKIELLKKDKNRFKTYKSIDIPEIKFKLPLTPKNLKGYGIFRLIGVINRKAKKLDNGLLKGNIFDISKLNERVKDLKKDIAKVNEKIKKVDKATYQVPKKATKTSQKPKSSPKPIPKVIPRKVPRITPRPSRLPKKPPIPKLDIDLDSNKLNNRVALFEGTYRERRNKNKLYNKRTNPIVTKMIRIRTTKNRLLQKLGNKIDNSAIRTMNIKIVSLGNKKKDIPKPKVIKKFTVGKKGLTEKPKFSIDTKGEKRELKKSRKVKRLKQSTKRAKKSSKIKRKPNKKTTNNLGRNKKTFRTKTLAEKNLRKGQNVYKVKGGWRRTSLQ